VSSTNRIILQEAAAGLDLNASAFGAMRLLGGSTALSWMFQIAVALMALAFVLRVWRSETSPELRAAACLCVTPLLSPYVPVYDLVPLLPATLFLGLAAVKEGGLVAHERLLIALSPLTALIRIAAGETSFSFGLALALATLACVAWRVGLKALLPQGGLAFTRRAVAES
jgi:multisubunit Na+/H+ antiporter MnhF subunit